MRIRYVEEQVKDAATFIIQNNHRLKTSFPELMEQEKMEQEIIHLMTTLSRRFGPHNPHSHWTKTYGLIVCAIRVQPDVCECDVFVDPSVASSDYTRIELED